MVGEKKKRRLRAVSLFTPRTRAAGGMPGAPEYVLCTYVYVGCRGDTDGPRDAATPAAWVCTCTPSHAVETAVAAAYNKLVIKNLVFCCPSCFLSDFVFSSRSCCQSLSWRLRQAHLPFALAHRMYQARHQTRARRCHVDPTPNTAKNKNATKPRKTSRESKQKFSDHTYRDARSASPLALADATKGVGTVARKLKM